MNPSILLVDPLTWRGTPSFSTLQRYFGGEPIATPGPAPQPPNGQKVWIRNAAGMTAAQEVVALQAFTATKDEVLGQFYYKSS